MYRLNHAETSSLLKQPESGMGYQVVDAMTQDYKTKRGVVYNAELMILDEDHHSDSVIMLTKSVAEALRTANDTFAKFQLLTVVTDSRTTVLSSRKATGAGGGHDAEVESTKEGDTFYRFSAFAHDRRVTTEHGMLPGTFATTEEDGSKVKTGVEAVERYALPIDGPASHRFTIRPLKDTKIRTGIVQQGNGHPGGGIEAIYTEGTTKDTVAQPAMKLPDD